MEHGSGGFSFEEKNDTDMDLKNEAGITRRSVSVITGVALLVMAVVAFFVTDLLARLSISNPTDHLKSTESYLRYSILGWLVIFIADIVVAWGLYIILKKTSESLSLLTAWFRLIYSVVLGIAICSLVFGLILTNENNTFHGQIDSDQFDAVVAFFITGFKEIWSFGLILFGFHLLGLGYLVLKSRFIPGVWGILLLVAALGYLITNSLNFLLSDYQNFKFTIEMIFILPMILGEMGLAVWLILKGEKRTIELKPSM